MRLPAIIGITILTGFYCIAANAQGAGDTIGLTLKDAVEAAIKNNLGLKMQRIAPGVKKEALIAAESIFDPVVNTKATVSETRMDSDTGDIDSSERKLEAGVARAFPYGTNVSLNVAGTDGSDMSAFTGEKIEGESLLTTLVVSQPLLKNRGVDINRRSIKLSDNEYQKARLEMKQALIDTVVNAKNLYWALYSSVENLAVQKKSLHLAGKFLSEMEAKVEIGSAASLDTLQAEAEVASREEAVIVAENDMMNNQDNLLNFIYGGLTDTKPVKCLQKPEFEISDIEESILFEKALQSRPDYLQAQYDIDSAKTDVNYMENQKKPKLDLNATLGYNVGSSDGSQSRNYQDYYSGALAVSLEFPWGLQKDKAGYRAARMALDQSEIRIEELESRISLEIRSAVRNVKSSHKRYHAAKVAENLAQEKLEAEEVKFENGLSTSYNILQNQRDLTDAMVRLVNAAIAYQSAMIELNQTVGVTLEKNNIRVKEENR